MTFYHHCCMVVALIDAGPPLSVKLHQLQLGLLMIKSMDPADWGKILVRNHLFWLVAGYYCERAHPNISEL